MARVLTNPETLAHRAHPELQTLDVQDFAALKQRLSVLGYYGEESVSITDAYEKFKQDISLPVTYDADDISREGFIARVAAPYIPEGQASLDTSTLSAKDINDIARAAVADAGGDNDRADFGRDVRTKMDTLVEQYQAGTLDSDGIAMLQGTLRSSEHMLKIDGEDGPKTRAAVADYVERKGAYFTNEERIGESGWDSNTGLADGTPIADYENDFHGRSVLPTHDDQALYVYEDQQKELRLALDQEPGVLSETQIKMMQGTLNIASRDMDPRIDLAIDGRAGPGTKEALQRFWEEKGLPVTPGMNFDELNSHHFEVLRYWTLENRDAVLQTSQDVIKEQMEAGELSDKLIENTGYDDEVAALQGTLNMLGHETTIDGRYGGQTAKNLVAEPDKYRRDPDMDFERVRAPSSTISPTP